MDRTKTILTLGLLVALLLSAACAGDDDSGGKPEPTTEEAAPEPTSPAEPEEAPSVPPEAEEPAPEEESIGGRTIALPDGGSLVIVAGTGEFAEEFSGDSGPATEAALTSPEGLAFDAQGNMYIGQVNRISKVDPSGEITTVAGTGSGGYSGDGGPATAAEIGGIAQLAVDSVGNLYFADWSNGAIRRVDLDGVITTVAETSGGGFPQGPSGVAVDADDVVYFVAEIDRAVSRIEADGSITTVAGTEDELSEPLSLVFDASGNLYIGMILGLRKLDTSGTITTLIEDQEAFYVAVDVDGNVYFSTPSPAEPTAITRVSPDGERTVIVESGDYAWADDGPAEPTPFVSITGVAVDAEGTVYISDRSCSCVYRYEPPEAEEEAPAAAEEASDGSVTVELQEVNSSGQSGTAVLTSTPDGLSVTIEVNSVDLNQHGNITAGTCQELGEFVDAVVETSQTDGTFEEVDLLRQGGGAVSLVEFQSDDFVVLVVDAAPRPGTESEDLQSIKFGLSTFPVAACGEIPRQ